MEWRRDRYVISTDRGRLDVDLVHRFLSEDAYWSPGVARDARRALDRELDLLRALSGRRAGRLLLGTADAHSLYERFGFGPVDPARMMERRGRQ